MKPIIQTTFSISGNFDLITLYIANPMMEKKANISIIKYISFITIAIMEKYAPETYNNQRNLIKG